MDSVRFGRALGIGARGAAKALAGAVDAATSPNPRAAVATVGGTGAPPVTGADTASPPSGASSNTQTSSGAPDVVAATARSAARATVQVTRQVKETQRGVVRGSRRFGEAVWGPLVKVTGVLWLEITGAFFGIFALFAGQAAWTHRGDLLPKAGVDRDAHIRAMVFLGVALLFIYFCVTSFLRARRRERLP